LKETNALEFIKTLISYLKTAPKTSNYVLKIFLKISLLTRMNKYAPENAIEIALMNIFQYIMEREKKNQIIQSK
jgi:hypothetical protein